MTPINGVSLELYAKLGAEMSDCTGDSERCAQIAGARGVARPDWDAAVAGWTARMQDMSLMGRVAMAYMPLYQAALARRNGVVSASFEDFVAMSGAAKAMTVDGMLAVYGITMAQWTQIAGHWTQTMGHEMHRYASYGTLVEQEGARIRGGGQPRPATSISTSSGGGGGQAQAAAAPPPQAPAASGEIGLGTMVLVQWSDGNRYPGAVTQAAQGQCLVAFPDGRQVWVPQQFVTRR